MNKDQLTPLESFYFDNVNKQESDLIIKELIDNLKKFGFDCVDENEINSQPCTSLAIAVTPARLTAFGITFNILYQKPINTLALQAFSYLAADEEDKNLYYSVEINPTNSEESDRLFNWVRNKMQESFDYFPLDNVQQF